MYKIDDKLRLRWPVMEEFHKGWIWYMDPDIQYMVNGTKEPYNMDQVIRMFDYLNTHGEFYFIEVYENEAWKPIGDATLMYGQKNDVPITIGDKDYHGKGIGTKVLSALIDKAKDQGFDKLVVHIYSYNKASIKLYEKFGFTKFEDTEDGSNYILNLE